MVAARGDAPVPLTIQRGNSTLEVTLTPQRDGQSGDYRIGAWVRDSTAGVGTLSFYGTLEEGGDTRFGALGHAITDSDTQQVLTVGRGCLLYTSIVWHRPCPPGFTRRGIPWRCWPPASTGACCTISGKKIHNT